MYNQRELLTQQRTWKDCSVLQRTRGQKGSRERARGVHLVLTGSTWNTDLFASSMTLLAV